MSQLIRFSEAVFLALHSIIIIAKSGKEKISIKKISEITGGSVNHLYKVLEQLSRASYIASIRGTGGGYIFIGDPSKISLLDIFETIEGKFTNCECPFCKSSCVLNKCLFEGKIQQTQNNLKNYLQNKKLSDYIN